MYDLIIIGAGGHAKVIADIAALNGYTVRGFLDDNPSVSNVMGYNVLGRIEDCMEFTDCFFIIGIGNNVIRQKICEKYYMLNYVSLVHPTACIGNGVEIGKGTVVMPRTVINACTKIGKHCVINTGAVVEHDCNIGDYTFIAPNSTVCGVTNVGSNCWLGAGSVVNNVINICDNVTLGSGTVVIKDINQSGTYVGVPARNTN